MHTLTLNTELEFLKRIACVFPRHPDQLNRILEADAEIINVKDRKIDWLVMKTDGIHEEIRQKLYEDPWLIGWMAVTVSVSDLAAVAARPLGILLSLQLTTGTGEDWLKGFSEGVNSACSQYSVYVLGGDTNYGNDLSVTTAALGTIHATKPLQRKTILPGQLLYSTGMLGQGNALAYAHFFDNTFRIDYRPTARIREAAIVSRYATAAIDTSDGMFPALSVLSELNDVGFELAGSLTSFAHDDVLRICETTNSPTWIFFAGPHGEYELLFTISPSEASAFEQECSADGWHPLLIGKATEATDLRFMLDETHITCNAASISNLFSEAGGDVERYYRLLMQQHAYWQSP